MRYRLFIATALCLLHGCVTQAPAPPAPAPLSETEISGALDELLMLASARAVSRLGRRDGYWGDDRYRIALPPMVERAERYLRVSGNGGRVDAFHQSLNRAAEAATPQAESILAGAVRQVRWSEVRSILDGPEHAATDYFRRLSGHRLVAAFEPAVATATDAAGVTRQYEDLAERAGPLAEFLTPGAADLDAYVTARAVNSLFDAMAAEERRIRRDPGARGTGLLQAVLARTSTLSSPAQ